MPFTIKSPKSLLAVAALVVAFLGINSVTASSSEAGKGAPLASTPSIAAVLSEAVAPCASPITDPYIGTVGHEGRVTRLYGAYFGRNPDKPGFDFWLDKLRSGEWTNESTSAFFAASDEFKTRFGADLSDADFLNRVYINSFCREPDAPGREYWLGRIADGLGRGELVLLISDSAEFRAETGTD